MSTEVGGTFAGFAIERLPQRRIVVGGVRVPALDFPGEGLPAVITLSPGGRLRPGRYRVHLLADGPSEVRIDAQGLETDIAVAPETTTRSRSFLDSGIPLSETGILDARVPLSLDHYSHVALGATVSSTAGQAYYLDQCVASGLAPCPTQAGAKPGHVSPCPACLAGGIATVDFYTSEQLPPHADAAIFTGVATGILPRATLFALSLF